MVLNMGQELTVIGSKQTNRRILIALFAVFALFLPLVVSPPAEAAVDPMITGVIVNGAGEPIPGLTVRLDGPDLGFGKGQKTSTSDDGSFTLSQPTSGTRFQLNAYNRNQPELDVLETWIGSRGEQTWTNWGAPVGYRARTSDIDSGIHTIQAGSGFQISVSGPDEADARVGVLRRDGAPTFGAGAYGYRSLDDFTYGFVPGQYTVEVRAPGFKSTNTDVTLGADQVLPVSVTLAPGKDPAPLKPQEEQEGTATLRGKYTAKGQKANGQVTMLKGGEERYSRPVFNGDFLIRGIGAGTYRVRFVDERTGLFSSVKVTIQDGQKRVMSPKRATRNTVTLKGSAPADTSLALTRSDGQRYFSTSKRSRIVNGKPTVRGGYRFTRVIPGTYSVRVEARDVVDFSWHEGQRFVPRTYKNVKLSKDRSLKVSDGGLGGTVTATLRWANTNQLVTSGVTTAACKGSTCLRWTETGTTGSQPFLAGLESKPYRIQVSEGKLEEDLGPYVEAPEKAPYYLNASSPKVVRAVKGRAVDAGTFLISVEGGL